MMGNEDRGFNRVSETGTGVYDALKLVVVGIEEHLYYCAVLFPVRFMRFRFVVCLLIAVFLLPGCASVIDSAKYRFDDGVYRVGMNKGKKVYVSSIGDTTIVEPYVAKNGVWMEDTIHKQFYNAMLKTPDLINREPLFYQRTFDVDIITIPIKYRPAVEPLPRQLNADYSVAAYLGYRSDGYRFRYNQTPLQTYKRTLHHYGLSGGLFLGIGGTSMNEFVTAPALDKEYDGLVLTKGIAGFVAVQNFTVGLSIGSDNLMDKNRKVWIYENKLWYGLAFGVNLN